MSNMPNMSNSFNADGTTLATIDFMSTGAEIEESAMDSIADSDPAIGPVDSVDYLAPAVL